jgi:hypothetical protein
MRTRLLVGLILTAAAAFAQRAGGARTSGAAQVPHLNPIGQGNLMFPGQGNIARPGIANSGRVGGRAGGFGAGYRGTVYVPYAVGIDPFYGAGYGYGAPYYPPYDPSASYYPGNGYDASAPTPTVIINQNFQPDTVRPVLRDYSNVPLPPAGAVQTPPPGAGNVERLDQNPPAPAVGQGLRDDQPTIFLVAMKDHTIYPVIAYWVDGAGSNAALNYVTVESEVKRVPLAQVDRDMSIQLNAQRSLDFKLPVR